MRVALIGPVPPHLGGSTPGGVATHQVHLAEGLAAEGVEAPLLATNTALEPGCWRADASQAPYRIYRMPARRALRAELAGPFGGYRTALRYAASIALARQYGARREVLHNLLIYRRVLAEVRPDVIHVQHPLDRCLYARIVRRLERWRVPLIVTAHSLFGEHADATIRQLMAPNLRAADRVIAVSDHIADQAVQLGVDSRRVRVIRSGVDTQRFRPREKAAARLRLAVAEDACLVLFVGNLEPRKQVDVLLKALAELRRQLPSVRLLLVGSGESAGADDQTARLQQLTSELGLTDAVRFAGRLSDDSLFDAYAAADVFALPSSSEAQGIVALEAMACGMPVVASAVGGLIGTIEDGRTGFLVPAGHAGALAGRLAELLSSPEHRSAIGSAARKAVEERFAWSLAVAETIAVYREVLGCS